MNGRTDEENNFNQQAVKNFLIEDIRRQTLKSLESETGYQR